MQRKAACAARLGIKSDAIEEALPPSVYQSILVKSFNTPAFIDVSPKKTCAIHSIYYIEPDIDLSRLSSC